MIIIIKCTYALVNYIVPLKPSKFILSGISYFFTVNMQTAKSKFDLLMKFWNKQLQKLAAGMPLLLYFLGYLTLVYLFYLLFTSFWLISLLYLTWIYLDRHTCDTGGRPSNWVQNWTLWRYAKNYFPARLKLVPGFKLDFDKNYLFCNYPHGLIPVGFFYSILIKVSEFHDLYHNFKVRGAVLTLLLYVPLARELLVALGGIYVSAKSLEYSLTRPEGGHVVCIFPGGAQEMYHAKPGKYIFVVKKRKGFVRVALKSGASLVPVITFGEIDLFGQIQLPGVTKRFQQVFKKYLRYPPVLFLGRGIFQDYFGLIPRQQPLTTVVGMPIQVTKTKNPTGDQIDRLHEKFVQELVNLFERYKHDYISNPDHRILELE